MESFFDMRKWCKIKSMKKHIHRISKVLAIFLLIYVVVLIGAFFGVRYGLTNTTGVVDKESEAFQQSDDDIKKFESFDGQDVKDVDELESKINCQINVIDEFAPINAQEIRQTYINTKSKALAFKMILAVSLRLNDSVEFKKDMDMCTGKQTPVGKLPVDIRDGKNIFPWMNDEEWKSIVSATTKNDKDAILRAGEVIGIEPRLIVSCMIVEQLRLFHSQRELFKKVFEPLKILGNANKISLGVMGIKEATAAQIEDHLKDASSPYYLGKNFEHSLDKITGSTFDRLTSEDGHHYNSYLYGALYLKQMMSQWKNAGFDIQYRPEIVGTLFNVGFPQSKPKADPKVGGSAINIGDAKYSFGSLAYEFYYSGEMQDEFPYVVN